MRTVPDSSRVRVGLVPYFLVEIRGDSHRVMGLLAKAGMQALSDPSPAGRWRVSARLAADDAAHAADRVGSALGDEQFTIGDVRAED